MLFIGDDWAEAHHDVEVQDQSGRLARRRLPEGVAGMAALHALIADHLGRVVFCRTLSLPFIPPNCKA